MPCNHQPFLDLAAQACFPCIKKIRLLLFYANDSNQSPAMPELIGCCLAMTRTRQSPSRITATLRLERRNSAYHPRGLLTAVLLLLFSAAQSSYAPPIPVLWTTNTSATPHPRLDNERIQVALYSNDPSSLNVGMSVATQVPLHAVSSRGWSLMSDKSTRQQPSFSVLL